MKIRLKTTVPSMFHGVHGLTVGDEVEVDDDNAMRYISNGVAEPVSKSEARQADQAAERFDAEVAGAAAEEGVALVHPEDRADDLPVNAEALDPDAVVHDSPDYVPVPLDEVDDEDGDEDEAESEDAAAEDDSKSTARSRTRVRDTRRRNR